MSTVPITQSEIEWFTPECRDIARYFGIERRLDWDYYREKIYDMLDWAKSKTHSEDKLDWLAKLKEVERFLGSGHTQKDRMDNLYRYVRLDLSKKDLRADLRGLDKEMELLKKTEGN